MNDTHLYVGTSALVVGFLLGLFVGQGWGWRQSWEIMRFYDKRTQWEASQKDDSV